MIGALVYLQVTSLKNTAKSRVQRLKNPRYLFAALVGAVYFLILFFGRRSGIPGGPRPDWVELFGGFALFVAVVVAWILPSSRAALAFSEAEVAHLFPAPVRRRTLIHYKLIKSQLTILASTALIALVSHRWAFLAGSMWLHAAGWWLICSLYNLHLIGASFARERLQLAGLSVFRRRVVVLAAVGLVAGTTLFFYRNRPPDPTGNDLADIWALGAYVSRILGTAPVSWLLVPFRIVVRPMVATDLGAFAVAVWPVVLFLVAHYVWVVRSDVAFEEASVALAQKRADEAASRHGPGGKLKKRRKDPFVLLPTGMPSMAFLWKGLLGAGPFYYPQYWFVAGGVLCLGEILLGRNPLYRPLVGTLLAFCTAVGLYGLIFGPILARRGLAGLLQRIDVAKIYPVRGWQIVLGELLCPVVIFCMFEWIVLSLLLLAVLFLKTGTDISAAMVLAAWLCSWLVLVPVSALLFALNFTGALYFPAWVSSATHSEGGFEKVGHRLLFFVGYMVVLAVALLPAALFASVPVGIFMVVGLPVMAVVTGSLTASAILVVELGVAIMWLGKRFEQFDLSVELGHNS